MKESTAATRARSSSGLREVRQLLRDLFPPRPVVYWLDFLLTAAVGWGAFAASVAVPALRPAAIVVAVFALYRAVLFIHELSHAARTGVPGFEVAWNLLVGMPLLVPSFTYVGVHTDHHRRTVYGTSADPEYLPLGLPPRSRIVRFLLEPLLLPAAFVLRFVVLVPLGLLVPPLHRFLERRASSLVINPAYVRRELSPGERWRMMLWESLACATFLSALLLALGGVLPWVIFPTWYAVTFGASFVNQVRTLGAHRYRNAGGELDVLGQLLDSVNVPGAPWTELWAPVGLRYHALHHYVPDMPYHALGAAHRRLMRELPADSPYRRVNDPGLLAVLCGLWRGACFAPKEA